MGIWVMNDEGNILRMCDGFYVEYLQYLRKYAIQGNCGRGNLTLGMYTNKNVAMKVLQDIRIWIDNLEYYKSVNKAVLDSVYRIPLEGEV